jgi:hypothetical protein
MLAPLLQERGWGEVPGFNRSPMNYAGGNHLKENYLNSIKRDMHLLHHSS